MEETKIEIDGKSLEDLEQDGWRIIDAVAGDAPTTQEIQYIINKIVEEKRATFYSDILHNLTSERFPETEAKQLWQEILKHKYVISERLGRNVGIRVASLDYLENVKQIIHEPKIVEEDEFRETLKFATTDALTGVLNRRAFTKRLIDEIMFSRKEEIVFSVYMIDLDNFKEFNDSKGHSAGDLVLQVFVAILRDDLRKNDIIGRYGGDEFTVILPGTPKEDAKKLAEKIRASVEQEMQAINITASIGISEFPYDADYRDGLISMADEALYRAKEFGRNKVMYFKKITLRYRSSDDNVKNVYCLGDFNRWNRRHGVMSFDGKSGEWTITFNLKPGNYRYKFLVDGTKWLPDPTEKQMVDDYYGGFCSVLNVRAD
ncbi:MAG: DUF4032 domain-containing protein [Elusimicrobiota bacterium]